jgi:hypothetical protein
VSIISTNALDRMTCHNPQEVDNLLIEWLTALLLIKFQDLDSCGRLFPICFIVPQTYQSSRCVSRMRFSKLLATGSVYR